MIGEFFVDMVAMIEGNEAMFFGILAIINIVAFAMYGIDKRKAEKNKWRIPEAQLLGIAFIGGAFGAMCGMFVFRHKTQKKKFQTWVPLFFMLQLMLFAIGMYCYIGLNSVL